MLVMAAVVAWRAERRQRATRHLGFPQRGDPALLRRRPGIGQDAGLAPLRVQPGRDGLTWLGWLDPAAADGETIQELALALRLLSEGADPGMAGAAARLSGKIMAALKERFAGQMDFAKASGTVKALLG